MRIPRVRDQSRPDSSPAAGYHAIGRRWGGPEDTFYRRGAVGGLDPRSRAGVSAEWRESDGPRSAPIQSARARVEASTNPHRISYRRPADATEGVVPPTSSSVRRRAAREWLWQDGSVGAQHPNGRRHRVPHATGAARTRVDRRGEGARDGAIEETIVGRRDHRPRSNRGPRRGDRQQRMPITTITHDHPDRRLPNAPRIWRRRSGSGDKEPRMTITIVTSATRGRRGPRRRDQVVAADPRQSRHLGRSSLVTRSLLPHNASTTQSHRFAAAWVITYRIPRAERQDEPRTLLDATPPTVEGPLVCD